jgi:DNA-binding LacI/PurR family transcriptional regulator
MLKLKKPPTAIFAFNDEMAFGAIQAVKKRGMKIPDDMAIIGFDNSRLAGMIAPTLSSVAQPLCDMGSEAIKILVHRIRKIDSRPVAKVFKGELVIRDSTG